MPDRRSAANTIHFRVLRAGCIIVPILTFCSRPPAAATAGWLQIY